MDFSVLMHGFKKNDKCQQFFYSKFVKFSGHKHFLGHTGCHTKIGPNKFSRFGVFLYTDKKAKYKYLRFFKLKN